MRVLTAPKQPCFKAKVLNTATISIDNEHSEQARAPHTNGPRDVPRCGALSSSSKDAKRLDFILWGSEFTSKAAKRLDLIQTQVAQRRMQRVEVYARALRLNQHVK